MSAEVYCADYQISFPEKYVFIYEIIGYSKSSGKLIIRLPSGKKGYLAINRVVNNLHVAGLNLNGWNVSLFEDPAQLPGEWATFIETRKYL